MANEDVLRKIRSLLAKEGAGGTTPQEVAAAVGLAERLMEREGITRAILELEGKEAAEPEEEIKSFSDPLDGGQRKLSRWRAYLALTLARSRGCEAYQSGASLCLIGRPSDAEVVRYLYEHCAREIDRITVRSCRGEGRTYSNNFRLGCVEAIDQAIKTERDAERKAQREAASSPGALVIVNQAIARVEERAMEAKVWGRRNLGLRSKAAGRTRYDGSAREAGRSAGAGIYGSAKPGIGGGGQRRIGSGN